MAKATKNSSSSQSISGSVNTGNSYNRIRPEKKPSDDPVYLSKQRSYYNNQETILAKKRQYNRDVKEGKRIPVKRGIKPKIDSKPVTKKTAKEKLTPEQQREKTNARKRQHYKDNKKAILDYQASLKEEKKRKQKEIDKQNALEAFNKLNGW